MLLCYHNSNRSSSHDGEFHFLPFNDDLPISVKAEVRYAQESVGMGMRFINLKPEDRERIKKFVEKF